jgi:dTDP-4-amino-4,6-dideoxygalactose transaminase
MSVSAADRHASVLSPAEEYTEVGFNYRMTDLQAAIGLVQLGRLGEMVRRRREIAEGYAKEMAEIPCLRAVTDPPWGTCNFQSYWVEIEPGFPLDRDELMAHLASADISARRGIMAAHRQPAYREPDTRVQTLPVTERLTDNTLILPVFHKMSESEQARVIQALRTAGDGRRG